MGFEQYPFHNPEIPTLKEDQIIPEAGLELEPLYVEEILETYNFGSRDMEDVREKLENARVIFERMGDKGDALRGALELEARGLGGREKASQAA